jgi:phage terminase large subunit
VKVTIPYKPRVHQKIIHDNLKRWNVLVAHRRFGKTCLVLNELIKKCMLNSLDSPRYGYIAPTYRMAKQAAWSYLMDYTITIPDVKYHETELRVDLPGKRRIQCFGADAYQNLRGMRFDGIVVDEIALMPPAIWEVLRPALADRKGWLIAIGTPAGHNAFFDLYDNARNSKDWYSAIFKASETNIIDDEELEGSKKLMSPEQFEQEFECSFDAGVLGGIYTRAISDITDKEQITNIEYDTQYEVNTYWDLGIGDATSIWFAQNVGNRIHLIEYYENSGQSLEHYAKYLGSKDYKYGDHYGPHDLKVRELGSGKSRNEIASNLGLYFTIVPKLSIEDGINAARMILPRCWFDRDKCQLGLEALRQYSWERNDKTGQMKNKPKHSWASHAADAFRYLAVGLNESKQFSSKIKYPNIGII